MKRKLYLLAISLYFAISGNCQFIPQDINYPGPTNFKHYPASMSIVNESSVWLGTICYDAGNNIIPYRYAVHTNDGGNSWLLNSIPVTGTPVIMSLCAVDANTCFYDISNVDFTNSSIWKTIDGGSTWVKKTTTQFTGSGAFCDFYHAFDANEGVAVGDPTNGYFEIQRTTDGGDTWSRVPSDLIPPILEDEWGFNDSYSAFGDNVWFIAAKQDGLTTWSVRCYKSIDRGQNWTVAPIADKCGNVAMAFSSPQNGVFLDSYSGEKYYYRTSDGGETWIKDSLDVNNLHIASVSSVEGFDSGFVVGLWNQSYTTTTVIFTPDFFNTIIPIDSNLIADQYLTFKNASTGWISGQGTNTGAILKYNGLLTSIRKAAKSAENLIIIPNPTSTEALVKLPGLNEKGGQRIMIYNEAGKLCENRSVGSTTGWTKLNASAYKSGVYVLQVVSGNQVIATTKWVVQH